MGQDNDGQSNFIDGTHHQAHRDWEQEPYWVFGVYAEWDNHPDYEHLSWLREYEDKTSRIFGPRDRWTPPEPEVDRENQAAGEARGLASNSTNAGEDNTPQPPPQQPYWQQKVDEVLKLDAQTMLVVLAFLAFIVWVYREPLKRRFFKGKEGK